MLCEPLEQEETDRDKFKGSDVEVLDFLFGSGIRGGQEICFRSTDIEIRFESALLGVKKITVKRWEFLLYN